MDIAERIIQVVAIVAAVIMTCGLIYVIIAYIRNRKKENIMGNKNLDPEILKELGMVDEQPDQAKTKEQMLAELEALEEQLKKAKESTYDGFSDERKDGDYFRVSKDAIKGFFHAIFYIILLIIFIFDCINLSDTIKAINALKALGQDVDGKIASAVFQWLLNSIWKIAVTVGISAIFNKLKGKKDAG